MQTVAELRRDHIESEVADDLLELGNAGRIRAEMENRSIGDGEVQTACQQACPAKAIVFGDMNDPDAEVVREKHSPLNYALLGELNTRPRTTYQACVQNPNRSLVES